LNMEEKYISLLRQLKPLYNICIIWIYP
jgi:hypothetical protein